MIVAFGGLGFILAAALILQLGAIERRDKKAGPVEIAVWLRTVDVSHGAAWNRTKGYEKTLTGTAVAMGIDAARLFPYPTHVRLDTRAFNGGGLLVMTYQASASRWTVTYERAANKKPVGGAFVPLRDLPHI
jgi:hypothetical protein